MEPDALREKLGRMQVVRNRVSYGVSPRLGMMSWSLDAVYTRGHRDDEAEVVQHSFDVCRGHDVGVDIVIKINYIFAHCLMSGDQIPCSQCSRKKPIVPNFTIFVFVYFSNH